MREMTLLYNYHLILKRKIGYSVEEVNIFLCIQFVLFFFSFFLFTVFSFNLDKNFVIFKFTALECVEKLVYFSIYTLFYYWWKNVIFNFFVEKTSSSLVYFFGSFTAIILGLSIMLVIDILLLFFNFRDLFLMEDLSIHIYWPLIFIILGCGFVTRLVCNDYYFYFGVRILISCFIFLMFFSCVYFYSYLFFFFVLTEDVRYFIEKYLTLFNKMFYLTVTHFYYSFYVVTSVMFYIFCLIRYTRFIFFNLLWRIKKDCGWALFSIYSFSFLILTLIIIMSTICFYLFLNSNINFFFAMYFFLLGLINKETFYLVFSNPKSYIKVLVSRGLL